MLDNQNLNTEILQIQWQYSHMT